MSWHCRAETQPAELYLSPTATCFSSPAPTEREEREGKEKQRERKEERKRRRDGDKLRERKRTQCCDGEQKSHASETSNLVPFMSFKELFLLKLRMS